jgi:hypothetical protein
MKWATSSRARLSTKGMMALPLHCITFVINGCMALDKSSMEIYKKLKAGFR